MITRISLRNYRCHEKLDVDFKPLTVILGENNTGKSAVLEAIWFLRRARQDPVEGIAKTLDKSGIHPLGFRGGNDIQVALSFDLEPTETEQLSMNGHPKTIGYRVLLGGFVLRGQEIAIGDVVIQVEQSGPRLFNTTETFRGHFDPNHILSWESDKRVPGDKRESMILDGLRDILGKKVDAIYYLPPTRFPGKQDVGKGDIQGVDIGIGQLTSARIHLLYSDKDKRFQEVERTILELDKELTGLISRWLGGPETTIQFETGLGNFDIESMGDGLKKAIPCMTQLLLAPEGSTVLVEEPETNLHPRAIRVLVDFFVDMARKGKQIIMTTHSGDVVQRLWWLMNHEDGSLAEDISLVMFEKDEKGERSQREQHVLGLKLEDLLSKLRMFYMTD